MSGSNGFPASMYAAAGAAGRRASGPPPEAGGGDVVVNAAELRDALMALAGFGAGGSGGSGAGGPGGLDRVVADVGYPRGEWPAALYAGLYDDFGPAARAVELFPRECFQVPPRVYESEAAGGPRGPGRGSFDWALRELADGLWGERSWLRGADGEALWGPVLEADVQSGVGRYGALYVGLGDGLDPAGPPRGLRERGSVALGREEGGEYLGGRKGGGPGGGDASRAAGPAGGRPAGGPPAVSANAAGGGPHGAETGVRFPPYALVRDREVVANLARDGGGPAGGRGLAFVRPLPEHKAAVSAWEYNPNSPRFGRPALYALDLSDAEGGGPDGTVAVHWARVVHVAVGDCGGLTPAGCHPRMRQVRPELLDLLKVRGSGAEGYRRNCISGLVLKGDAGARDENPDGLRDAALRYQAGLAKVLRVFGYDVTVPSVTVNDPTPHVEAATASLCIRLGVPRRVWEGSEQGVLAADQDASSWGRRLGGLRRDRLARLVRPVVDRLVLLGVLPEPADGYRADWTEAERADPEKAARVAASRAQALSTVTGGNVSALYPPKAQLVDFGGKTEEEADALLAEAEGLAAREAEEAAAAGDDGADGAGADGSDGTPQGGPNPKPAGSRAAADDTPDENEEADAIADGSGWTYNSDAQPRDENGRWVAVPSSLGFPEPTRAKIESTLSSLAAKYGVPAGELAVGSLTGGEMRGLATRGIRAVVSKEEGLALKAGGGKAYPADRAGEKWIAVRPGSTVSIKKDIEARKAGATVKTDMDPVVQTVVHEFGHVLQHRAGMDDKEANRKLTPDEAEVARRISPYARTSYGELLAEAFVAREAGLGSFHEVLSRLDRRPTGNAVRHAPKGSGKGGQFVGTGSTPGAAAHDDAPRPSPAGGGPTDAAGKARTAGTMPHAGGPGASAAGKPAAGHGPPAGAGTLHGAADSSRKADVAPLLAPVTGEKALGGGVNATSVVTLAGGQKGVWKPAGGEAAGLRAEVPDGTQYRREAAASEAAGVLGLGAHVPPTVVREHGGSVGSVQAFAANSHVADNVSNPFDGRDGLAAAAAFDYVIGSTDRHPGNWMLTEAAGRGGLGGRLKSLFGAPKTGDSLRLIDNGLSLPTSENPAHLQNSDLLRKAAKDGGPLPDLSHWEGKRPRLEKALAAQGIEPEAVRAAGDRLDAAVAASKAGKAFGDLSYAGKTLGDHFAPGGVPQGFRVRRSYQRSVVTNAQTPGVANLE